MNPNNPYGYRGSYGGSVPSVQSQTSLMQRVSYLLATALIVTAVGSYLSRDMSPALWLPCAIGTVVCVFAINFTRGNPSVSLLLLYGLSLLEGITIGPMLSAIARGFPYGSAIIGEAAGLSALLIAGLGTYVWISNKDFGYLGKMLFYALLAVIVVSIVGMFWHTLAVMGQFHMIISLAIVALFVGFTLYDFSNIKLRYGPNDYVIATVQLYLDFLNLFMAILQILMSLAGGGSQRRG